MTLLIGDFNAGWGQGWKDAMLKFDILLEKEKQVLESRLIINREDFDEDHPAVGYLEEQIALISRLQRDLNR